jgi:hypothetical protein
MKRYWINQPSTHQPAHKFHGRNVLADLSGDQDSVTVYFQSGDTTSALMLRSALSYCSNDRWNDPWK